MRTFSRMAVPVLLAGLAGACTAGPREGASASASPSQPPVTSQATATPPMMGTTSPAGGAASAVLAPTQGNTARGAVTFTPGPDGVRVTAHLEGLAPGEHGFHLHEKGDCSAPDGSSAGDHWNPTNQPHGAPDAPAHHAGDLGNITADASGMAHVEKVARGLSLEGPQSAVGRSVIVHGKADDLKTQPSGNAGPRISCGVVTGGTAPTAEATRPHDPGE